jgi:glycosyltransferase involved in cell wall biosynthesis
MLWDWQAVRRLSAWIRRERPEIVHVHSQEAGLVGRLIARASGARGLVYTPQTVDIRRKRWQPFYQRTERALSRLTRRVIAVNEVDRARMAGWGIAGEKIIAIPNGIDLNRFAAHRARGEEKRKLGFNPSEKLVLQVGRLSAQKDPLVFVEGAWRIAGLFPGAQFAMLGEGPLCNEVKGALSRAGLAERVRLAGWQARVEDWLCAADVVTLTSRWEGTPYSLLEAMACSTPVVAFRVNGCGEIIRDGETGYAVAPGDLGAWVEKVTFLLSNPEQAEEMGRRGRQQAEEHFSVQSMVREIENLYREL